MITQVREPAVAGYFYPADPGELRAVINEMLDKVPVRTGPAPKALIVPHAGYIYSGPVAATAYSSLYPYRDQYTRVLMLGPGHRVAFQGLASSGAELFRTPLGDVPLDRAAIDALNLPGVNLGDAMHRSEHSLEVHLPFLQIVIGSFALVPLVVGDTAPETVAKVIDALWGGPETLIIVSSDLSHYLNYDEARTRDQATCKAIESMDAHRIGHGDACGATPVGGLLIAAKNRGMHVTTLDLRNSGDTAGGKDQVVGYGSWMIL